MRETQTFRAELTESWSRYLHTPALGDPRPRGRTEIERSVHQRGQDEGALNLGYGENEASGRTVVGWPDRCSDTPQWKRST
jgi:hypothetical protein